MSLQQHRSAAAQRRILAERILQFFRDFIEAPKALKEEEAKNRAHHVGAGEDLRVEAWTCGAVLGNHCRPLPAPQQYVKAGLALFEGLGPLGYLPFGFQAESGTDEQARVQAKRPTLSGRASKQKPARASKETSRAP